MGNHCSTSRSTPHFPLAGRGKTEQLLNKVHALDGTRDELGYAKAREAGDHCRYTRQKTRSPTRFFSSSSPRRSLASSSIPDN